MIRAIILDVDGVVVGNIKNYNFPLPSSKVISALKNIEKKGVNICLCTAKPLFSVERIIKSAFLDNLHVTNGGAVIMDPINNVILHQQVLDKKIVLEIMLLCSPKGIYQEYYSTTNYYIDNSKLSNLTKKHSKILGQNPHLVKNLVNFLSKTDIVKIVLIARSENEKEFVSKKFSDNLLNLLNLTWTHHPNLPSLKFCVITAKENSKKESVIKVINHLKIPFDNVLGIGDTIGDWQFIQLCGFMATLENADCELKNKMTISESSNYYIGNSVNKNGIIDVFRHFNLM